ncbi:Imm51 family immunity protein [Paenibacillus senegalimassiliensis]|uniref:Imm51 family immunity protein n=1 Tax=Paenibacillus senegalimassiliensis TaxID=1737426 RepID=UPI00292A47BE|nr:Imm51 family immunity protein [Paenibacillus senegalimassiliensis]
MKVDQALREQLEQWYEVDEHQNIVDALEAIPVANRDYEMVGQLGRAYNNVGRYEDALAQFAHVAEQGKDDSAWHYRSGYSYYFLGRFEEGAQAFAKALELNPGDEHSRELLGWCQGRLDRQQQNSMIREQALREKEQTPAKPFFEGLDLSEFWDNGSYAESTYTMDPPSDALIASVEEELGYKLPASYIALMKQRNGGIPQNTCFPTKIATSWADDHVAISSIMGIGRDKDESLCGDMGSRFMIEDWGYPDIGIVICDCPSAGHDVIMLDYRHCGKDGEPEVIHVDQESEYEITFLAPDFETFIRGLVNEEEYDTAAEDKANDLRKVAEGQFSPLLEELCNKAEAVDAEQLESQIRAVCTRIVEEKGHFSFHADELSLLMYDVQFWLYTNANPRPTREEYLDIYPKMIAFGGEFSQGGYAPSWITDWLDKRMQAGWIKKDHGTLSLTEEARKEIIARLEMEAGGDAVEDEHTDIAPFKLVDQGERGMSVILPVGSYLTELFASRADEGFEGSGYDWTSLAFVYLAEQMPDLEGIVRFDPEGSMFCAYSSDREALKAFAVGFKQACENEALIRDLFSRAELD